MTRRPPPRTRAAAKTTDTMHWTTRLGVGFVALIALVVAALNVFGWASSIPGPLGIAAGLVAFGFEGMAFVLLEHIFAYFRTRRWGRLILATIALVFAVGMNIEGGHRGLNIIAQPLWTQAETTHTNAQRVLDEQRANITEEVATIRARLQRANAGRPDVARAPAERIREWVTAYELTTHDDRARLEHLEQQLRAMPTGAAFTAPYPEWGPYAVAAGFVFITVFGLTMFGVKVPGPAFAEAAPKPANNHQAPTRSSPSLPAQRATPQSPAPAMPEQNAPTSVLSLAERIAARKATGR